MATLIVSPTFKGDRSLVKSLMALTLACTGCASITRLRVDLAVLPAASVVLAVKVTVPEPRVCKSSLIRRTLVVSVEPEALLKVLTNCLSPF